MKFSALMDRVRERGVVIGELRAGGGGPDPQIRGICEDSRKVRPGDLFVARSGSKKSGAEFIEEALAKGAVAVVTAEETGLSCAVPYARVAHANLACALLAHECAGNPTAAMKMIGITGTKGKTTVAYLLRSVLQAAGHTVGMIGTVEIDDGATTVPAEMTTPGSVELVALFSRMKANGVTHCVMEVSSHALHQHRVAGIDFAVAIFTNLTGDHLDYHKTMEEYAAAKAMLFEGLKEGAVAVVNADDKWCERIVRGCEGRVVRIQQEGKSGVDRLLFGIRAMKSTGMKMWVWPCIEPFRTSDHNLDPRLIGRHNAYNITGVYAAGYVLGVDIDTMIDVLCDSDGAPGRLQRVNSECPFSVFVDYAHTHDALENVLTALRATMRSGSSGASAGGMLSGHSDRGSESVGPARAAEHGTRCADGTRARLICLFGCGGDRDRTKRPKMGAIAERLADVVIVTSDNPRTENPNAIIDEICAGFSPEVREQLQRARGTADTGVGTTGGQDARVTVEPDRRAAIRTAIGMAQKGDVVLLAGKGHENYQIIGTTKHHFDDVEEAEAALRDLFQHHDAKSPRPPS